MVKKDIYDMKLNKKCNGSFKSGSQSSNGNTKFVDKVESSKKGESSSTDNATKTNFEKRKMICYNSENYCHFSDEC